MPCVSAYWRDGSHTTGFVSYLIHIPVTAASPDLGLWVSDDWVFGNVWGHCGLSQLWGMWGGHYRHLVGGGQRCCGRPVMRRTESYLAPNVNSTKAEKL